MRLSYLLTALVLCACSAPCFSQSPREPQAFFTYPDITSATLAPSGEQVAITSYARGLQRLSVVSVSDGQRRTLLDLSEFSEADAVANAVEWIDDTHLAVQYSEIREGVARLADTKRVSYLLIVEIPDASEAPVRLLRVRTKGRLVSALPDQPNVFLYAKSGAYSKVYSIDVRELSEANARLGKLDKVDGGQFVPANQLASVEGFAMRWFIDASGAPKASLTVNAGRKVKLSEIGEDNEFSVIRVWDTSDADNEEDPDPLAKIVPIFMASEKGSFYCLSYDEDERNTVYKVDFSTGDKTLIYQNDTHRINSLILSDTRSDVIGVRVVRDGGLQNVYFGSDDTQAPQTSVQQSIDAAIGNSLDRSRTLHYREGQAQPGHYVVHDEKTGKESLIGSVFPDLLNTLDSTLIEGYVDVEGLEIPYLLTLPDNPGNVPSPMIVMPHGGPIGVFDDKYFDVFTQYIAANGYAVLRVNFRGSSGYTDTLREAGKLQWGKLMLRDIYEATLSVLSRSDISNENVCAFGASYGGYAAAMLTIQHPDTFRCAVSLAGVTDINLHLETPRASNEQRAWMKEHIGDSIEQYDELKALSPVYSANQMMRPILIAHGAKDETVDVEHAHRLRLALEKFDKPHEFKIFADEGHSLDAIEARQEFFGMLIRFLAENIDQPN